MTPFSVKVVSRVGGVGKDARPINNRIRQLVAARYIKLLGWDKSEFHIRQLNDDRAEISLVVQLTPAPIKQRKAP